MYSARVIAIQIYYAANSDEWKLGSFSRNLYLDSYLQTSALGKRDTWNEILRLDATRIRLLAREILHAPIQCNASK